jgi:hypothetical protein
MAVGLTAVSLLVLASSTPIVWDGFAPRRTIVWRFRPKSHVNTPRGCGVS